jgi:3-hydroxy acid dehydrogenase/malonic semialdehyde reductase
VIFPEGSTTVAESIIDRYSLQFLERLIFKSYTANSSLKMATMKERLSGKTILITGASSGIGASTAVEFARTSPDRLRLVLAARRVDKLSELSAKITKEFPGVKVHTVQLDVSKPEEVKKFVGSLPGEFQEIDILVNNAYVF